MVGALILVERQQRPPVHRVAHHDGDGVLGPAARVALAVDPVGDDGQGVVGEHHPLAVAVELVDDDPARVLRQSGRTSVKLSW